MIAAALSCAQTSKQQYGEGWLPEFNYTGHELVTLAEATPAAKYSWRPAAGVRSISEVYVHIAVAHLFFLRSVGVTVDASKMANAEKKITSKPEVIAFFEGDDRRRSQRNYPKLDLKKKVHFVDADRLLMG